MQILHAFHTAYCFGFLNERSGKYKIISKVDNLVALLACLINVTTPEFIAKYRVFNEYISFILQCPSFVIYVTID